MSSVAQLDQGQVKRVPLSKAMRFEVLERDKFKCVYCGRSQDDGAVLHVDHVHPVSKGGTNDIENLVTACADCNLGKGAKSINLVGMVKSLEISKDKEDYLKMINKLKKTLPEGLLAYFKRLLNKCVELGIDVTHVTENRSLVDILCMDLIREEENVLCHLYPDTKKQTKDFSIDLCMDYFNKNILLNIADVLSYLKDNGHWYDDVFLKDLFGLKDVADSIELLKESAKKVGFSDESCYIDLVIFNEEDISIEDEDENEDYRYNINLFIKLGDGESMYFLNHRGRKHEYEKNGLFLVESLEKFTVKLEESTRYKIFKKWNNLKVKGVL